MTKTNDGFIIAEKDLEIRGPGNIMGTQQSGIIPLKIANIIEDTKLLKTTRDWAKKILTKDKNLNKLPNSRLQKTMSHINNDRNIWNYIS